MIDTQKFITLLGNDRAITLRALQIQKFYHHSFGDDLSLMIILRHQDRCYLKFETGLPTHQFLSCTDDLYRSLIKADAHRGSLILYHLFADLFKIYTIQDLPMAKKIISRLPPPSGGGWTLYVDLDSTKKTVALFSPTLDESLFT